MKEFTDILPQLSIGVIAVLALISTVYFFSRYLERRDLREESERKLFLEKLDEREFQLRKVEFEVRASISNQLISSTDIIKANTGVFERFITHLDAQIRRQN